MFFLFQVFCYLFSTFCSRNWNGCESRSKKSIANSARPRLARARLVVTRAAWTAPSILTAPTATNAEGNLTDALFGKLPCLATREVAFSVVNYLLTKALVNLLSIRILYLPHTDTIKNTLLLYVFIYTNSFQNVLRSFFLIQIWFLSALMSW